MISQYHPLKVDRSQRIKSQFTAQYPAQSVFTTGVFQDSSNHYPQFSSCDTLWQRVTSYYNWAGPLRGRKYKYSQQPQWSADKWQHQVLTHWLSLSPAQSLIVHRAPVTSKWSLHCDLAALGKHSSCHAQTRLLATPPAVMWGKCLSLHALHTLNTMASLLSLRHRPASYLSVSSLIHII